MSCFIHSWNRRSGLPSGLSICSNISFSPNANTGTSDAPVFSAIFTNPLRLASVRTAQPGRASSASAAPPTTIATDAPGARVRFRCTLALVTLLIPSAINTSRVNGNMKLIASVSKRRSSPGNACSKPVALVAKVISAPTPMTPCGWYPNR